MRLPERHSFFQLSKIGRIHQVTITIDKIIIFTGLPDGLIDAALVAARKLRAEPATLNGTPVPAWLTVKVNFSVR